jgi:hypothetical protein
MEFAWSSAGGFGFYQGGVWVSIFISDRKPLKKKTPPFLPFYSFFVSSCMFFNNISVESCSSGCEDGRWLFEC